MNDAAGPALFVAIYQALLKHPDKTSTPQALKCIGLINAIAWQEAKGETVTFALLADLFSMSVPGIWRLLNYLKLVEVLKIVEDGRSFSPQHTLHAPDRVVAYLRRTIETIRTTRDLPTGLPPHARVIYLQDRYAMRILGEKEEATAAFALQAIGFFLAVALMNMRRDYVTSGDLVEVLSMSPNAFRSKIRFLQQMGLLDVRKGKTSDNIGQQTHIAAPLEMREALREWRETGGPDEVNAGTTPWERLIWSQG